MTLHSTVQLAFDGSSIDGSLFTSVTGIAKSTRWLNGPLDWWTNTGLGVFAVLMVIGFWNARRRDNLAMTRALAAPVAVVFAFAVAEVIKKAVAEVRPCYSVPHAYFVDPCPVRSDYAFPSGHTTTAFATVAALWLLDRRLAVVTAAFAVFESFTRVYLGDHYPHDVVGAAVIAVPVAYLASRVLSRFATPLVGRLRGGGLLQPVLTAAPRGAHAAGRSRPADPVRAETARPDAGGPDTYRADAARFDAPPGDPGRAERRPTDPAL
ncbi:phosphatase PAP2 family protein [Streptomyces sp. NRRL F-5126]|uniref:phosphatase PAP2 family protein n=1 Tax=Streptomyces sp. NRRL F-5126 TaxID=1463857 RepID=UPI00068C8A20|nr:phosphatase PAP2 family protein [Streptomyces sp. NRRL F-5126]